MAPHRSSLFAAAGFKGFPDDFGGGAAIEPQRSSSSLCDVDGLMSADFTALLGGAATIGPHRGSSSDFGAFSGLDLDEFATAFEKIKRRKPAKVNGYLISSVQSQGCKRWKCHPMRSSHVGNFEFDYVCNSTIVMKYDHATA